jgi:hypothetical protein
MLDVDEEGSLYPRLYKYTYAVILPSRFLLLTIALARMTTGT